jgi:hypothetical protein
MEALLLSRLVQRPFGGRRIFKNIAGMNTMEEEEKKIKFKGKPQI